MIEKERQWAWIAATPEDTVGLCRRNETEASIPNTAETDVVVTLES